MAEILATLALSDLHNERKPIPRTKRRGKGGEERRGKKTL